MKNKAQKATRQSKTHQITQRAFVEVRFDTTLDPKPYEKTKATRSLLGAVAEGKVVISVSVNGVESNTIMSFPALSKIERKLPDVIVRRMAQHTARFLPKDYERS